MNYHHDFLLISVCGCCCCPVDVVGCCDVVLDREQFLNATKKDTVEPFGPHLYRKQINVYTGEISMWLDNNFLIGFTNGVWLY